MGSSRNTIFKALILVFIVIISGAGLAYFGFDPISNIVLTGLITLLGVAALNVRS